MRKPAGICFVKFASAITTNKNATEAVNELAAQVLEELGAEKRELAILFVHPHYISDLEPLLAAVRKHIGARHLIGCTGAAIVGEDREIEQAPALSLLVGRLPNVDIAPFHLTQQEVEESSGPAYWQFQLEVSPEEKPQLILLADPFTIQTVQLVQALNAAYPGGNIIGGLASGAQKPGQTRLFVDGEIFEEGAVGVALAGDIAVRSVVAQGCKPIGEPLTITRADKNVILELGGRPPLAVLQEMVPQLSKPDQELARTALFLGRVINEYQENFHRGDFLVRNLIGHDPQSGALAVGDLMRTGQTVQFQVRDGQIADEDLHQLLLRDKQQHPSSTPLGALLFTCLGRGQNLFGSPHHDVGALHQVMGAVPTAGCFCNGEIGPVGSTSHVHGFTCVIGLFCEPTQAGS
jgi:small ligand-binding sensory domain FIST